MTGSCLEIWSAPEPICVRTFIVDQIESPLPILNFQMVGGRNENGHGQQYGFPVAVVGHDVQCSVHLRTLRSCSDTACGAGELLEHDPEKRAAAFPRDKRQRRLRGDHANQKPKAR